MKKILSLFLTLCIMSITAMPITASAATSGMCGDNATWVLDDNGTLTIAGTGAVDNCGASHSEIETVIIEYGITSINESVFYDCENLKSVIISDSVTSIGESAFSRSPIKTITLPNNITKIAKNTFAYCMQLTDITIPNSVEIIEESAFYECGLTNITLSNSLTTIKDGAFRYCSIKELKIPETVLEIGSLAFGSNSFTELFIPHKVSSIGPQAFQYCSQLKTITVDSNNEHFVSDSCGVLYNIDKSELLQYPIGNERTYYDICDNTTAITDGAFTNCINIMNITIPDNLKSIGNAAFAKCRNLRHINIPDSVTSIGTGAFGECVSMVSAKVGRGVSSLPSSVFGLDDDSYGDIESETALKYIALPKTLNEVSVDAFDDNLRIDKVYYEGNENEWNSLGIGEYKAFSNSTIVFSFDYSENIPTMFKVSGLCGENAKYTFESETGLLTISGSGVMDSYSTYYKAPDVSPWYKYRYLIKKVVIDDGVTAIGGAAFVDSINLEEVFIGKDVTSIYDDDDRDGAGAFARCPKLKKVNIPENLSYIGGHAFSGTGLKEIVIPSTVQHLGDSAFQGCINLYYAEINAQITYLNRYLFEDCSSLETVILSDDITQIEKEAFADCSALKSIVLPQHLTTIKEAAFRGCINLIDIAIPDSVYWIERYAFYNTKWLDVQSDGIVYAGNCIYCYKGEKDDRTILTIPEGTTGISPAALCEYTSLNKVTIPESVKYIGYWAFRDCSNLSTMNFNAENCLIGTYSDYYVFSGCPLTNVNIGNNVETIPNTIFTRVSGLTKVVIPPNVSTIGYNAFYSCYNLKEIVLCGATDIGWQAFANCTKLEKITMANSVKTIARYAFYQCPIQNVYYEGDSNQWEEIQFTGFGTYPYGNDSLLDAKRHYNQELPEVIEYLPQSNISGTFNFASGIGQADYYYKDNYFEGISQNYNHELSKMSMRLALSAFSSNNGSVKYQNAEKLLTDLNFKDIDYNYAYTIEPDTDSIGVLVGKKHIAYTDDDYTLLAVAIRGGGYKDEWYGNFRVGNEKIHEGFNLAKGQVVDFITNYVKEKEITGKIKIWITGYSRAGATANLTAAYLNENLNCLSDSVTLTTDNIYAYCFEPPAGVKNPDNKSGLYNNIFNIVNQHDFVPMVAMKKWGFDRYGITKYLPSAYTNKDYTTLKSNMSTKFKEYSGENYAVDNFTYYTIYSDKNAVINKGTYNQGVYLEHIIDKLADNVGSTENYENEFQAVFCEYIGQNILGSGNIKPLCDSLKSELTDSTLIALLSDSFLALNPSFTWIGQQTAYWTLRKAVKDAFENVGTEISNYAVDTIVELIFDIGLEGVYNLLENVNGIKQSHYPELCMAWLDTIDESDFTTKRLRTLYLNCPVDLEIYDSNNNLVAAIYDDVPQSIDGSSIFPFIDENGQKVVYLPQDEEYRIEVVATDDGEVTYTVQEEDLSTNSVKVINYNNMIVSKTDTLTGTAENLTTTNAVYSLLSNTTDVKEAEIIENAEPLSVTTSVKGNGYTFGDNIFYKGEYAQLTATPTESEEFIGWFNGETLVSKDVSYRFQVIEPIDLTAKFTSNTCEIMFMDNENVISSTRIIKGETVEYPQATDKDGYTFNGYYTEKEFLYLADESVTYSEDTKLYAKYDEIICEDYIQYYIKDNFAYIYKCTEDVPSVRIPVSIEGYPVSTICSNAFENAISLWNILIPDTVTVIEETAFDKCENLQEVYYIGTEEQWEQISIADGNDALIQATKTYNYCNDIVGIHNYGCGYEEGNILIDLTFAYVYKDCFAYIDVFDAETKAKKAGFTQTIEKMTDYIEMSFPLTADDNEYIVRVSIVNSETDNKKLCSSVEGYMYAAKQRYTIDDFDFVLNENGEAEIESYFGNETDLIIPETLGEYPVTGLYNFGLCGADISSVYIGEHITKIGEGSLSYCYNLNNITVAENNLNYCSVDGMLYNKDKTIFMQYLISKEDSSFEIPEGVKVIGAHAFESAENIKTIKLPETLERIEWQGLACSVEGDLILPESVNYIGKEAFANSKISSITIPRGTAEIAASAFSMMPNLTAINVDENNLGYVSENGVLFKTDNGSLVKKKIGLIAYPTAKSEKSYAVPDGVYSIYPSAFGENELVSIILPPSLRVIGEQAFVESINLKTVCYKGNENQYSLLQIQNYNDWLLMADVVFNYDGNPNIISSAYAEFCDKTIFANVEFSLLTQDGTLFVAVYDKDGRLVSLDKKEVSCDEISYDFEFEIESFSNDYTIKVFCWENGNTIKPLSVPFTTNIQEVIITDAVLESEHPYTDDCNDTQVFEYDGDCTSLSIRFTEDCELEEGFDYVYIYDANDECQCFTGTELANKTVIVNGNIVKIQLVADGSVSGYGYKTKRIVAIK